MSNWNVEVVKFSVVLCIFIIIFFTSVFLDWRNCSTLPFLWPLQLRQQFHLSPRVLPVCCSLSVHYKRVWGVPRCVWSEPPCLPHSLLHSFRHTERRCVSDYYQTLLPPPTAFHLYKCCNLSGLSQFPEQLQSLYTIQCLLQKSRTSSQWKTSQRRARHANRRPTYSFPHPSVICSSAGGRRHQRAKLSDEQDAQILCAGCRSELASGSEAGSVQPQECFSASGVFSADSWEWRWIVCSYREPEGWGSLCSSSQPSNNADWVSG